MVMTFEVESCLRDMCACSSDVTFDAQFVDINMGCPIDMVFNKGMGSGLMPRKKPLEVMVRAMAQIMTDVPLTLKMRTGVYADKRIAHTIIPTAMKAGIFLCNFPASPNY